MSAEGIRINKYLADRGLCSRREAEELIRKGWVKINGEVLNTLGYKVQKTDRVEVDEAAQSFLREKKTVLLNKPLGYVSQQSEDDYPPAIRLITPDNHFGPKPKGFTKQGFAPAGRLDIDSTGLLVLTQDGKVAKTLVGENTPIEKEYVILVQGEITKDKIQKLRHGLQLDGRPLKKAKVTWEEAQKIRMILLEGRKRQIRRMCELVDLKVTSLRRVRIGRVKLGSLPIGQWRLLKQNEKF